MIEEKSCNTLYQALVDRYRVLCDTIGHVRPLGHNCYYYDYEDCYYYDCYRFFRDPTGPHDK